MLATVDADDNLRTDKQARFVQEYVKDFNATQAAIRAGYSEATAAIIGWENLQKPEIQAAIERRMEAVAAVAEVDAAMVVRELLDVATADLSELVSVHRDCCRFCHGTAALRRCRVMPSPIVTERPSVFSALPNRIHVGIAPRRAVQPTGASGEHLWGVVPEWMIAFDRFCTPNDLYMDEVMSIMTKSHSKAQRRQFRAA
jgi:hypothetical protein